MYQGDDAISGGIPTSLCPAAQVASSIVARKTLSQPLEHNEMFAAFSTSMRFLARGLRLFFHG